MPKLPSAAWLKAVDDSARLDFYRRQGRARAGAGALAAFEIQEDRARLPARGAGISVEADPDDDRGDGGAERAEQIHLAGDFNGEPRYLPAPPPHIKIERPDEAMESGVDHEHRLVLAAEARAQLSALAQRAGVPDVDLDLVRRRLGALTPVPWSDVAKGVGRKEDVRRRVKGALARLRDAAGDGVDVMNLVQRAYVLDTQEVRPMTTMTTEQAERILRDGIYKWLKMTLNYDQRADAALRVWADAATLKDVVTFNDEDGMPDVELALPLFLLDYAVAMIRRDYGLTEEQARTETDQIAAMIREDWPKVFSGSGEVEYRTYSIEVAAGEVKFDVVGQAMDYIEAWMKRRRASA